MLAPLLAKLHISPTSTEELIREVYEVVTLAVDDKKLSLDATGRNSLYKIHVSLGKIVNSLNEKEKDAAKEKGRGSRKSSVTPSVLAGGDEDSEDKTELPVVKDVGEEEEEEATIVGSAGSGKRDTRDSLVEDLLSEDGGDVEMSGM
jgi:condensin complex subunit 3